MLCTLFKIFYDFRSCGLRAIDDPGWFSYHEVLVHSKEKLPNQKADNVKFHKFVPSILQYNFAASYNRTVPFSTAHNIVSSMFVLNMIALSKSDLRYGIE